jgi:hypothetical protein
VGIVTVQCACRARWRARSYGIRSCQHRHTTRHQARPTCVARGGDRGRRRGRRCPAPRGCGGGWCPPGCRTLRVGACCRPSGSWRLCVCWTRSRRRPGRRRRRACHEWGSARGSRRSPPTAPRRRSRYWAS